MSISVRSKSSKMSNLPDKSIELYIFFKSLLLISIFKPHLFVRLINIVFPIIFAFVSLLNRLNFASKYIFLLTSNKSFSPYNDIYTQLTFCLCKNFFSISLK